MTLALAAAGVAAVSLILYGVLGGADFGGGVWDLFASGPRRNAQRKAIINAIGPVWEANHTWLVFAVITALTCFPAAYADASIGLYVPLSLVLAGIVLRGTAFIFRNYTNEGSALTRTWTAVFGVASLLTPFFLGDAAGALATGTYAWTSPFALGVGVFAIAICAQIAAVFILREIDDSELHDDFRRRALRATLAAVIIGALLHPATLVAGIVAGLAALAVAATVWTRHDRLARFAVGFEVTTILAGWFASQAPALIPGRFTLTSAAASEATLAAYLVAAACGAVFLIPSLVLLFRIFKAEPAPSP